MKNAFINQHEWRVVGMSRSGNHAIINWILAQAQGRTCFLNCTEPKNNPFQWPRCLGNGRPYIASCADFDLAAERNGQWSHKDYLVYSHEDVFLGMLRNGPWEALHDSWVGTSAERRDILILRDPFNLFASRIKANIGQISRRTAVRMWKQHAKEFLGTQRYLPQERVVICYNEWVRRKRYRREIARKLGLNFTDRGFNNVPSTAGGSSFDSLAYRRKASKMRVFDRWRTLVDDPSYVALFDDEMIRLAQAIFPHLPAVKSFVGRSQREACQTV